MSIGNSLNISQESKSSICNIEKNLNKNINRSFRNIIKNEDNSNFYHQTLEHSVQLSQNYYKEIPDHFETWGELDSGILEFYSTNKITYESFSSPEFFRNIKSPVAGV